MMEGAERKQSMREVRRAPPLLKEIYRKRLRMGKFSMALRARV